VPERPIPIAGIVTGLEAEAAVLRRAANFSHPDRLPFIVCAGAGRARGAAQRLLAKGAETLISFGIAGGLDPALRPGRLIVARQVIGPGGSDLAADPRLHHRFMELCTSGNLATADGVLASSIQMVTGLADKQMLHQRLGALAVDMESHAVATIARSAGVPFVALRAVADPAERTLPGLVRDALDSEGRPRTALVLARLCLRPWAVPAVLQLRRDQEAALATLQRVTEVAETQLFGR
jgi:adenosylhomocysteine nucleosidase